MSRLTGSCYGTTDAGGAHANGTVFEIGTGGGTLTTLCSFCSLSGCADGTGPEASLYQGTDNFLYGTNYDGGSFSYYGTVFKITTGVRLHRCTTSMAQTVMNLSAYPDGGFPEASLIQGTGGKLYGATFQGDADGEGTIFSITTSGTLNTLHSFDGTDGSQPLGPLVQDTNGTFYGTRYSGGTSNHATVFSLSGGLKAFVKTMPAAAPAGTNV